jgi:metal-responsive CopG/Arc/MetJ family transcriptional regulator
MPLKNRRYIYYGHNTPYPKEGVMATLTVNIPFRDDLLRQMDEFAKKEALSRDELVDKAIRIYLNKKKLSEMREWRREYVAKHGVITEEEINEEIRKYREDEEALRQ